MTDDKAERKGRQLRSVEESRKHENITDKDVEGAINR